MYHRTLCSVCNITISGINREQAQKMLQFAPIVVPFANVVPISHSPLPGTTPNVDDPDSYYIIAGQHR
jgi:hypothetical protein